MAIRNYRDLIAWQKAMDLVGAVYDFIQHLPQSEAYGLGSQLRRAAISVPVNIAEGQGRKTSREFRHFTRIAHGSVREIETEVLIAIRLGYASKEASQNVMDLAIEVGRLLNGLLRALTAQI